MAPGPGGAGADEAERDLPRLGRTGLEDPPRDDVADAIAACRQARQDLLGYWIAASSLSLIGAQVVLGAITVLTHNAGWTVALHLADAWLVLGAATITALGVWQAPTPAQSRPAPRAAPAGRAGPAGAPPQRPPYPGRRRIRRNLRRSPSPAMTQLID